MIDHELLHLGTFLFFVSSYLLTKHQEKIAESFANNTKIAHIRYCNFYSFIVYYEKNPRFQFCQKHCTALAFFKRAQKIVGYLIRHTEKATMMMGQTQPCSFQSRKEETGMKDRKERQRLIHHTHLTCISRLTLLARSR